MKLVWFWWIARHFHEYGYSHGPLLGTIGTIAVLLTALVTGAALHRHRPADMIAGGLVCAVGVGWLALH